MSIQRSRILASACAWVLGMAATHAFAQAAPAAGEAKKTTEIEEVTVTGSFIPTLPEDSAISVQVINFENLQNLGRPSNLDLVKSLTETGYSIGELNRNNGFPIDAQTINLRSLGPRFTTVVFNNRRFPEQFTPAFGRFNNVQSIPTAAIGSVEVLRTGGAAIYGADAVAGVVNYITRKNVTGLELNADYTRIIGSEGDYDLSGIWGSSLGSGTFMIAAGWNHRSKLEGMDRDFGDKQYLENPNTGGVGGWNVIDDPPDYSFQRPVGAAQVSYTPTNNPLTGYAGQRQMGITGTVRDPGCTALGGFAGWSATPSPVCYGQVRRVESLVEHSDDYSVYSEYNLKFATNMKFHLEGLFYYRDLPDINVRTRSFPVVYPTGQTAYFVSGVNPAVGNFLNTMFLNPNNTTAFTAAQIAAITNPANPGRATISTGTWSLFTNGGNPLGQDFDVQRNTTTQYRLSTSLSGGLPSFGGTDFEWEVAATFHYVKDTRGVQDILVDRLQGALNGLGGPNCTGTTPGANGCQFFNPFSSSTAFSIATGQNNPYFVGAGNFPGYVGGTGLRNDPSMVRWLYVPLHLDRTYKMTVFDPVIRGSTGINLPGGPIKIAIGGQLRYSTEDTDVNDLSDITLNPCPTVGVTTCTNATGPLVFGRPNGVMGANRDTQRRFPVYAAFFETDLPIVQGLDLDIAGRYEKFISDYTDRHNDVVVPSASLKWTPISWLSFRGSYGLTFGQVNPPRFETPVALTTTAVGGFPGFTSTSSFTSFNYHNLDVQPERGENISVGFIVQAGNFRATVDYGLISIKDYSRTTALANVVNAVVVPGQLNSGPLNTIFLNCSSPLLTQQIASMENRTFIELNGGNTCVQGVTTLQNLVGGRLNYTGQTGETNAGKLWSNAIDVTTSYRFELGGAGSLTSTLDGTYVTKWTFSDFSLFGIPVARGYDGVGFRNTSPGRVGNQGAIPHYRATFSLLYQLDKHTLNLQSRYIPGIIDDGIAGIPSLGIQTPATTPAYNANIGPNTSANCPATPGTLTSNLGSVPAGAGTGDYGAYGTTPFPNVGYCANQNVTVLSGYSIKSFFNLDLIYRFAMTDKLSINTVISNVLNRDPSFARDQLGYDAGFGSPLGRTYRLGATVKF